MNDKKQGPMRSQVLGIVWVSVGLLFLVMVAFFSSRRAGEKPQSDVDNDSVSEILVSREDSVFRSRYKGRVYQYDKTKYNQRVSTAADTIHYSHSEPLVRRQPLVVELNTADTTTLMLLHGIGPTFAKRIVRYRERLGGFFDKGQLMEVYGFTPELLDHIGPYITINADSIRRICLDTITLKQLIRHPYIEYYQARDIIRLRDRGIRFTSADDLRAVPSMADSTLQRLLPYIDFAQ